MTWREYLDTKKDLKYKKSGSYEKVFSVGSITSVSSSSIIWDSPNCVVTYKLSNSSTWLTATSGEPLFEEGISLEGLFLAVHLELTGDGKTQEQFDVKVSIVQDADVTFYGIVGIPKSPTWESKNTRQLFDLTVQSISALLSRTLIINAYQDITAHDLILDIFNEYISIEGIELGEISEFNTTYTAYAMNYKYCSDVLDEIAEGCGGIWYVSFDKKFYFLKYDELNSVDSPAHLGSLKCSIKGINQRNVQFVLGTTENTEIQVKEYTYDKDTPIVLDYAISKAPVIRLNGNQVDVGINGIDTNSTDVVFFYSYGSSSISLNSKSTTTVEEGDKIEISYIGSYDIVVVQRNDENINKIAKRTKSSGRIEKVASDVEFTNSSDATDYANGLLDDNDLPETEITITVNSLLNTDLLTIWRFNYPTYRVVGDYVIVSRTVKNVGKNFKEVSLTLKNRNYWYKNGGIFNKYSKNIRRLSVSETDVVLKAESFNDNVVNDDYYRDAFDLRTPYDDSQMEELYGGDFGW